MGKSCRNAGIGLDGWHGQMRRHDAPNSATNGFLERDQLQRIQALAVHVHHRQGQVRVDCRISVPREMLGGRQHTSFLSATDKCCTQLRYQLRVLPVGPNVDDRVARVIVNVQYWSEYPVHTKRSRLHSGRFSLNIGPMLGARRSNRHIPWKGDRVPQPKVGSTFKIGGDQQRQLGSRLDLVNQHRGFIDVSPKQDEPADVILSNLPLDFLHLLALRMKIHCP